MKARTLSALGLGLGLMMASLPLLAAENWLVYQRGPRLSLAIDRASLATQADGLLHFVHEERYAREMYEKKMDVRFLSAAPVSRWTATKTFMLSRALTIWTRNASRYFLACLISNAMRGSSSKSVLIQWGSHGHHRLHAH